MPCFGKMAKIKQREKGFHFSFTKTLSVVSKNIPFPLNKEPVQKVCLQMHINKQPATEVSCDAVNFSEAGKCQGRVPRELTFLIKLPWSLTPSDCLTQGSE